MKERISVYDGKYTVVVEDGKIVVLRYGKLWRNETGDNLIMAMFSRIQELTSENEELKDEVSTLTMVNERNFQTLNSIYGKDNTRKYISVVDENKTLKDEVKNITNLYEDLYFKYTDVIEEVKELKQFKANSIEQNNELFEIIDYNKNRLKKIKDLVNSYHL